ncbi:prostaglandin e2 receptor ep4 subtype [Plakobranchus ocellatus]|uniref:Prostaglandin e2 receptor ep4 subtype n=1 Tax=Plakobranchus ocellatus TaxID=259542 RepID=A0AAV4BKV5_9GAST|nr:prostaglandin e2 receptor ep4 subtype [Plakobranchus ocellatus]
MDSYNPSTVSFLNNSDNSTRAAFSISSSRTVTISSVMFAAGVIGNGLALILMATSPVEQKKTRFYKLMFGLAFTDLVGTCLTSPVVINIYASGATLASHMPLCHYFSFMLVFAAFATMSLVCAMAVERYICLCHPYFYQCKFPKSYGRYAVLVSWAVSLTIAALPLIGLGRTVAQFPNTWCFFDATSRRPQDRAFSIIFATLTLLAITVTLSCNVAATFTVLAMKRRQRALTAGQGSGGSKGRSLSQRFAEMQMLVILVGVTVIFTSCFAPLMVFTLICQTDLLGKINVRRTYLLMIRLASLNPILDPWVYILVRREFRWRIICMFKCLLRIDHRAKSEQAYVNTYPLRCENGGLHRGSCDSEPGYLDSPVSPTTHESDLTFWTFCIHCLCDPPVQRSSSNARARASFASQASSRHSPARQLIRNASSESMLNGSREKNHVLGPTLASDLELLNKVAPA